MGTIFKGKSRARRQKLDQSDYFIELLTHSNFLKTDSFKLLKNKNIKLRFLTGRWGFKQKKCRFNSIQIEYGTFLKESICLRLFQTKIKQFAEKKLKDFGTMGN